MPRKALVLLLVVALAPFLLPVTVVFAGDPAVEEVTKELMCQCGCGMVVPVCNSSMECLIGEQITDVATQQLAEGRTKSQVIDYFVGIYGEKIRALPRKSGFDLSAWVMPFVGVIAGVGIVSRFIYAWRRPGSDPAEDVATAGGEDEDLEGYERLVDEQLDGLQLRDFQ